MNVREVIAVRACVKVPPAFLRGAYKSAMRLALQEIVSGMEIQNQLWMSRGWKLFILLPRILLFRPARGGKVPKNQLLDRFQKFANGEWVHFLGLSKYSVQKESHQGGHCREEG